MLQIRPNDKIYLINSGEFEDLIPKNILQKTINSVHCNDLNCIFDDFNDELSMVDNLENIYKKYGFGEGYKYSHDYPDEYQQFLPDELKNRKYV